MAGTCLKKVGIGTTKSIELNGNLKKEKDFQLIKLTGNRSVT